MTMPESDAVVKLIDVFDDAVVVSEELVDQQSTREYPCGLRQSSF